MLLWWDIFLQRTTKPRKTKLMQKIKIELAACFSTPSYTRRPFWRITAHCRNTLVSHFSLITFLLFLHYWCHCCCFWCSFFCFFPSIKISIQIFPILILPTVHSFDIPWTVAQNPLKSHRNLPENGLSEGEKLMQDFLLFRPVTDFWKIFSSSLHCTPEPERDNTTLEAAWTRHYTCWYDRTVRNPLTNWTKSAAEREPNGKNACESWETELSNHNQSDFVYFDSCSDVSWQREVKSNVISTKIYTRNQKSTQKLVLFTHLRSSAWTALLQFYLCTQFPYRLLFFSHGNLSKFLSKV